MRTIPAHTIIMIMVIQDFEDSFFFVSVLCMCVNVGCLFVLKEQITITIFTTHGERERESQEKTVTTKRKAHRRNEN